MRMGCKGNSTLKNFNHLFRKITLKSYICRAILPNLKWNSKFIDIAELITESYKNLLVESDLVKSSAIMINLVSNSAAELLPISNFTLNSEELLYSNLKAL